MAAHASTSDDSGISSSVDACSGLPGPLGFVSCIASQCDASRLDEATPEEPISMDCSAEGSADTSLLGRHISQACTLRLALRGPSSPASLPACPAGERVMLIDRGAVRRQAARQPPALTGGPLDAPATLHALDSHGRAHSILCPLPVALPCHQ
jgi:hypothetical protein